MTMIPENTLNNLFENLVTQFVKENLESIMKAEIKHFMKDDENERNSRNGYYKRTLHTKYGRITVLVWKYLGIATAYSKPMYLSSISVGMAG